MSNQKSGADCSNHLCAVLQLRKRLHGSGKILQSAPGVPLACPRPLRNKLFFEFFCFVFNLIFFSSPRRPEERGRKRGLAGRLAVLPSICVTPVLTSFSERFDYCLARPCSFDHSHSCVGYRHGTLSDTAEGKKNVRPRHKGKTFNSQQLVVWSLVVSLIVTAWICAPVRDAQEHLGGAVALGQLILPFRRRTRYEGLCRRVSSRRNCLPKELHSIRIATHQSEKIGESKPQRVHSNEENSDRTTTIQKQKSKSDSEDEDGKTRNVRLSWSRYRRVNKLMSAPRVMRLSRQ